mgnify:CR=1 FL=1
MKNLKKRGLALKTSIVTGSVVAMGSANAALIQTDVDAIVTGVLADVAIAVAAGFAIFGVVKASAVGFGLLASFISKGARG